ncbi:Hypothetical predicted protein [Cloeon dipterum]|uniref:Uncharacterized protein n=1 Tax=Cloeon dipterum TaxID=197152 RepID=A0A8S1CBK8_9INSE|nr:Hypothetical predicted protein [Cloeon dipterum]
MEISFSASAFRQSCLPAITCNYGAALAWTDNWCPSQGFKFAQRNSATTQRRTHFFSFSFPKLSVSSSSARVSQPPA